jgi:cell wall-associated NlpC family hydrolase
MTASVVAAAAALLLLTAPPTAASPTVASPPVVHRVVQGDTLWSLARRYGTTPERLAAANGIRVDAILSVGQPLRIPVHAGSTRPQAPEAGRPTSPTQIYRVRAGDTLWSISRRFGTRPERLAAMNRIGVDDTLRIGQALTVPLGRAADVRGAPTLASTSAEAIAAQRKRLAALPSRGAHWVPQLLALSQRFLGVRYRWGGTSPSGFDCSGFLLYVFGRMGVSLPRTTYEMFAGGVPVPREDLQAGDIVFFQTLAPGPSHAGIYMGDGRFIHSSSGTRGVGITPMDNAYYARRYLGARRF